jgi:uncharacterized protein
MSSRRMPLTLAALLLLAGCGSSPKTHFYTLSPVPGSGAPALSAPVTVADTMLPPALDRREMVRLTSANTVEISDQERWAAPLGDMTRRVLSQDLAQRLPGGAVILPDAPAPPHTRRIAVAIAQFAPDGHGRIVLTGSWSLVADGTDKPLLRRDFSLAIPSPGSGGDAQAAGMSRLLGKLASDIATGLAGKASAAPPPSATVRALLK